MNKMKKILAVVLCLAMVLTINPVSAIAESDIDVQNPVVEQEQTTEDVMQNIAEDVNQSLEADNTEEVDSTLEAVSNGDNEALPKEEQLTEEQRGESLDEALGEEKTENIQDVLDDSENTPVEDKTEVETVQDLVEELDSAAQNNDYETVQEVTDIIIGEEPEAGNLEEIQETEEPEVVEGILESPATVNFTNAAALVKNENAVNESVSNDASDSNVKGYEKYKPGKLLKAVASFLSGNSTTGRNVLSADVPVTQAAGADDNNGLFLYKKVTRTDDNYRISLEAYTTGTIKTETKAVPTDIILVLDQSGSMKDPYTETMELVPGKTNSEYSDMNNLFVKLSNGKYVSLRVKGKDKTYTYEWEDESRKRKSEISSGKDGPAPDSIKDSIYQKKNSTRLEALKTAASSFISNVQADAVENNVDHRIAVVGFAASGKSDNAWNNTELLSTSSVVAYNHIRNENYIDALVSANVGGSVNSRLTEAINRLDANGGTYIEYGMEMAQGVINNNDGTGRNRVVIVLTDGIPGSGTWGSTVNNTNSASVALTKSTALKKAGVTVYTVGIFNGADATSAGKDNGNNTEKSNYFMQNLSSNNGKVQDPGYYLSAGDANNLNEIFESISNQISTPAISLDSKTVLKDTVTKYFEIPEDADTANIKFYTADCTGQDEGGNFTFGNKQELSLSANDYTIDKERGVVTVKGFDYNANFCAKDDKGSFKGKKLIVEFNIQPKEGFLGGNQVPTNGTDSGIYENKDSSSAIESFKVPTVDVEIPTITVNAQEKNIYYGGNQLKVKDSYTTNVVSGDWKSDYVNITYPTDETLSNTVDTSKNITVTVSPKTEGTAVAKSGSGTIKVDVFKPEFSVTGKDYEAANSGIDVDLKANDIQTESVTWKHGAVSSTDTGVTMTGSEPAISNKVYSFAKVTTDDGGTLNGSTFTTGSKDADFNITGMTCKVGTNDYFVTKGSGLTVTPAHENDSHDFTVLLKTSMLTIKKTGMSAGETAIFEIKDGTNTVATVTVPGNNGSVTVSGVTIGKSYTVSEVSDWSWKYNGAADKSITIAASADNNKLEFNNTKKSTGWLNAEASAKNVWNGSNVTRK